MRPSHTLRGKGRHPNEGGLQRRQRTQNKGTDSLVSQSPTHESNRACPLIRRRIRSSKSKERLQEHLFLLLHPKIEEEPVLRVGYATQEGTLCL